MYSETNLIRRLRSHFWKMDLFSLSIFFSVKPSFSVKFHQVPDYSHSISCLIPSYSKTWEMVPLSSRLWAPVLLRPTNDTNRPVIYYERFTTRQQTTFTGGERENILFWLFVCTPSGAEYHRPLQTSPTRQMTDSSGLIPQRLKYLSSGARCCGKLEAISSNWELVVIWRKFKACRGRGSVTWNGIWWCLTNSCLTEGEWWQILNDSNQTQAQAGHSLPKIKLVMAAITPATVLTRESHCLVGRLQIRR